MKGLAAAAAMVALLGATGVAAADPPLPIGQPVAPATAPPSSAPPSSAPPSSSPPPPPAAGGAIEQTTLGAPAARWTQWSVQGTLIDDVTTVEAFLEPVMEEHRSWAAADQRQVVAFLRTLGYDAVIQNRRLADGGVHAVLLLDPVTFVRYVTVDIDARNYLERLWEPIYAEDLKRRMSLRPGSPLERDAAGRAVELENEAARLEQYLRNEGFYDAHISMERISKGPHAALLRVHASLGSPYHIGRLTIVGNTAITAREIASVFHHPWRCIVFCFGEARFSRLRLNRDVQAVAEMYQRRGFPGVRVRTDFDLRHSFRRDTHRVEFTVEVRERRKVDVVFEGSRYGDDKLRSLLTLDEEGSYDDVELESSGESIRRYYQSQGYFEASVTWERVRFGLFERIVYTIYEGPRLKVAGIEFVGNRALSDERLRQEIVTRPFRKIVLGAQGGYATGRQLEQDVERLTRLYLSLGYRDAMVELRVARSRALLGNAAALAAAVAAQAPASGLQIDFDITEGALHQVEDVRFEFIGPAELDVARLSAGTTLRRGDSFTPERALADGEGLRRLYFDNGFARAEVETSTASGRSPSSIVVTHRVTANRPARIGKVAVRGNFKTRDWVIEDELKLRQGRQLTADMAEAAMSNLRNSGLFSSVQIDYVGLDDPRRDTINVLVQVEERHDNWVESLAGGGYSTDKSLFAELGAVIANMWGSGARFDVNGILGVKERSIEAKLAFPGWITRRAFGTAFLLELGVIGETQETERFGELTSLGASVAATKEFYRGVLQGLLLSLRYDFRQRNRDVPLVRPAGNSDDISTTKVTTRSSTIGPLIVFDRRRDRRGRISQILAVRGYRLELRGAYGEDALLGSARFLKLGGSAQHFLPLGRRFRLSNGLRYDHAVPLGGDVALPEVERFFAGGDTTVRGFEQDRLATEIIEDELGPLDGVSRFRVVPAGGTIRFIYNLDLQVEVWDLGFPVASAIFYDSGLVTNSLVGLKVRDLRHSIGLALFRWVTPFGSLSLEYGVPLDPQLGDDPRGRFHVNFGFLF
ncbi:MAG TPA: POTRA domain-containing protein [Kofleriaceae bacterium]|nr:POTRA domain-containing protein [Kofleriaceae bacterium]